MIQETNDIIIYPNPATTEFTVKTKKEILKIKLLTVNGKVVIESEHNIINTSAISKGIYILSIMGKDFNETKRVVIQ